jgi:HSP20 family protein
MEKRFDWKEPWDSVNEAMNRVIDDFGSIAGETFVHLACRPAVALRKTTSAYELEVAVPGVAGSDVDAAVEGNTVVVSGRWPARAGDDASTLLRDELPHGRFRRAIRLPEGVEPDRVKARLASGILTVHLPLSEPSVRTEVPIEEADEPEAEA